MRLSDGPESPHPNGRVEPASNLPGEEGLEPAPTSQLRAEQLNELRRRERGRLVVGALGRRVLCDVVWLASRVRINDDEGLG